MAKKPYVERALFIVGAQNTGKSTQLRSMFLDWRLGNKGQVPQARNLANTYLLSNERWLYLRLTSPHEARETLDQFLKKCAGEISPNASPARRWNFAGALQSIHMDNLPGRPNVIAAFAKHFKPERVRVVILSPDRAGNVLPIKDFQNFTTALRALPAVEIMTADATTRTGNGLMYADFFDFT